MNSARYLRLCQHEGASGAYYLELHDHPHQLVPGISKRTVNLHSLIEGYAGPALFLDFDDSDRPIGLEILYPSSDEE